MGETAYRIEMYLQSHTELPKSLSDDLPVRDDHMNRTTDGWNRPLIYVAISKRIFILISLGSDGISGGSKDDEDIIEMYHVENGKVVEVPRNL